MVEHEVKKKTRVYGTVAALSAIVLVAMIYTFGQAPVIFPSIELPTVSAMKTFSSYDELKSYIVANAEGPYYGYQGGPLDSKFFGGVSWQRGVAPMPAPEQPAQTLGPPSDSSSSYTMYTEPYSTTNIQVAGVDEADIVKTDGKYIYMISSESIDLGYWGSSMQNVIFIVKADPRDARVVSKITLDNNTYPAGLFLSRDNGRLVVLASQYHPYAYDPYRSEQKGMVHRSDVDTFVNIYDISDRAYPVLVRNFTISGSYFNSRMIGDYVYAVVSQPANIVENAVTLPMVYEKTGGSEIPPSNVYYSDAAYYGSIESNYFTFTTFLSLNILDDAQQPTNMTVMMGGASNMYVSMNNIYITYPTYNEQGQYSSIYRVRINGSELNFEAKGSVPGYILNQYSMDEYNEHFRIATNWFGGTKMNNVYVLNMSLGVVGRLEGLAEGENLHSVRFMGDRVYLVTFKKTDPLFVIDLSKPADPKVLGELKIPGYSDYLHPYDGTHLIGVGKETVEAEQGDFAWYQGLKLSLFDVSNVNNPVQLAKYVIGDRGTDSIALSEPKAFLFDKSKNLLVIPVNLAIIDVPMEQRTSSTYGNMVWQGAYVFTVTLNGGFVLKGNVTHIDNTTPVTTPWGEVVTGTSAIQYGYNNWVSRSLYIGNTLYTVSNAMVKLNNLVDMKQIAEVTLA